MLYAIYYIPRVWFRENYRVYKHYNNGGIGTGQATTATTITTTTMPTPEPIDVKEKKSYRQLNKEEKSIVSDTLITFLKDPNIRLMDKWFIMKRFLTMMASILFVCRNQTITLNGRTPPT